MVEENNSWIMRTKFSHTVVHRMDSVKFPAIEIPNPSRHDALGQKVESSSLSSFADPLEWRNKSKEQELKHKEQTLSPVPASRTESSMVNKGPVTSLNNKEQNLKHSQSNGVPYLPTFSAESSSSNLDSERSAFYLSDKEKSSKARQKSRPPPLAKLTAGTNRSGFDFQMPILIMSPNSQNSKTKQREQSPNFRRSSSIAVCEIKSIQSSCRDPSSFPAKYINSRSVGHNSNRGQKLESKGRALSPLPSTALSEEFKLARSDTKRFSTPIPRRKDDEMVNIKKMLFRDSGKVRSRKDNTWARYFNHSGGKVSAVDATEECRIDLSELYLGDRFAIGANSRLYRGLYKSQSVAVKIIILPDDEEDDFAKRVRLEKQFTGEVAFLSNLHHRNVLKLVGAFKNPPSLCILTEYLSGGSLRAFLHKPENKKLPLQKLVEVSLGIARGLEYIHSKGIVHRDLKPENILFDQDCCVKIADFGIACEETYCDILADDPGTYRFMAPEMIKKKPHGRNVDVYSFGLVLWEMLTGSVPFEGMIPYQAAFAVVNKNLRPSIPPDCPLPLRVLIEQCWTLHPNKRPEFSQIVKVLEHFESALAKDGTLNSIIDTSNRESSRWFHNQNRLQKHKSPSTNIANLTMPRLL